MEFSERIRAAIQHSGKTQAMIAKEASVSPSAIAQYLSGNVRGLKAETAEGLSRATGFSAVWLATGRGPQRRDQPMPSADSRKAVPLLTWEQATSWQQAVESFSSDNSAELIPCPAQHSDSAYALRVGGEAMFNPADTPSFRDGNLIFVDPLVTAGHRSCVVVATQGAHQASLRRLLVEGHTRYLEALNPSWPNRIQPLADAVLCGVVIGKYEAI